MTTETGAIVAATCLGPILAVALSLWREGVRTKYGRRLHVFRTLMATRQVGISNEHVNALNLIEVDFYKCRKVQAAWNDYKEFLNDRSKLPASQQWLDEKEKLLAKLLSEIAVVLNFKIPAIDIFKGGYAPEGWAYRDTRAMGALEFIHELSEGKKVLPLWLCGVTQPQQQPPGTANTLGTEKQPPDLEKAA
jgi:hypothetical protein